MGYEPSSWIGAGTCFFFLQASRGHGSGEEDVERLAEAVARRAEASARVRRMCPDGATRGRTGVFSLAVRLVFFCGWCVDRVVFVFAAA